MRKTVVFTSLLFVLSLAVPPCARAQSPRAEEGCPEIVAGGPVDVGLRDNNITFQVKHAPQRPDTKVTYYWTLSAGSIVGGQGTAVLVTDLTGARTEAVEVTVEVGGLSVFCSKSVSYTLPPTIACIRPFDSYGNIRFEDEKARLDNYAVELQNAATAQGYLVCYGGRKGRAGEAERRCKRALNYIRKVRGIDAARVVIVDGGFREELTVEPWIVPPGAQPPPAVPTVDSSEVEIIQDPPR